MSDGRRAGELDLADTIESYLWDSFDGEDALHWESISESAVAIWEQNARDLLESLGINRYYDASGNVRKQERPDEPNTPSPEEIDR